MAAIITTAMRVLAARQLLQGLSNPQSAFYLFIGRTLPWTVDANPPPPINSVQEESTALNEMIAAKRISPTDVSLVAPRYNWTPGTVYMPYTNHVDLTDPINTPTPYYVVNSSLGVYKCIGNANGLPSTIEPTSTSTAVVTLADGYQWKYLYTINSSDALSFVTPDWIPATTLTADDGSTQWQVQQAAIPGTVDRVDVVASGTYTQTPTVSITGDGTGAAATAIVTNGHITAINVTNNGSGYTYADVSITGGGNGAGGASAIAIVSPRNGHGADPVNELAATYTMTKAKLAYGEGGAFTTANDYRRIGIMESPNLSGSNTLASALDYSQATSLTLTAISGTEFSADELVTGASSGAMGYVLDWDANTGILRLVQTQGSFEPGERVAGAAASGSLQTISGNVVSATSNTVTLPNTASSTDDAYTDAMLTITNGTGSGQSSRISGYSGLNFTATLDTPFTTIPDTTSVFVISTIDLPQLDPKTGNVLYLDNRSPIPRAPDQAEDIRIIIPN